MASEKRPPAAAPRPRSKGEPAAPTSVAPTKTAPAPVTQAQAAPAAPPERYKNKKEIEEIVAANTGLVKSVALRLSFIYGEDAEDLIQIGYIGLIKAARRFDAERGLKFSTYAVPLIAGEIRSQMRDSGAVKVSRSLKSAAAAVRRQEEAFAARTGRSPRISELAAACKMTEEQVTEALQAYEALRGGAELEESGLWLDDEEKRIESLDVRAALSGLEPREKQVIMLRYYRDMTQQQTARVLGLSQVQVCRIEKKTLSRLAKAMGQE